MGEWICVCRLESVLPSGAHKYTHQFLILSPQLRLKEGTRGREYRVYFCSHIICDSGHGALTRRLDHRTGRLCDKYVRPDTTHDKTRQQHTELPAGSSPPSALYVVVISGASGFGRILPNHANNIPSRASLHKYILPSSSSSSSS